MNMEQINTNPVTRDVLPEASEGWITPTNHRYSLRL